ncbi:MAG: CRISPR-associated helicase Cas3' [Ignavibacteria bacterium]
MVEEKKHIAHVSKNLQELHYLEDHLKDVSDLAGRFAASFENGEWGRIIGLWHDLGKFSADFQKYIRVNSGYEEDDQKMAKVDHTSAGAVYSKERLPDLLWQPLAYCIAGHHAGLLNWVHQLNNSGDLQSRLKKTDLLDNIRPAIPNEVPDIGKLNPPCGKGIDSEYMHLWIRMLFSCLVDADFLDTERFMNPELFEKRGKYKSVGELKGLFDSHMSSLLDEATRSELNTVRKNVLEQCILTGGKAAPGYFSLNVPTGGGKTLSSMAFALQHAIVHNKQRIIFVIPYTSIITQTAQVYKEIFGEENVIEHHSNIDEDTNTQQNKLASENWDAPIIVTTNVQFFESLYANRTSRCRKLHNIVNSVIILDEAQMLPSEFLKPVISVIKGLVTHFGSTILLSTATLPALTGKIGSRANSFIGIPQEQITEIIPDHERLAEQLKRVNIEMPDINKVSGWDEIAAELINYEQALCIVNTRKDCRRLYKMMPEGTFHLSRMMCGAHIIDTIAKIKKILNDKEPVRVISTQLIEAGVDIDFPVVYRALAGLDSIAQSGGRCNREGKLPIGKLGLVKVFIPPTAVPPGLMRKGADTMKEFLSNAEEKDFLSPEMFKKYFESFYCTINTFDKPDIKTLLTLNAQEMSFQFAKAGGNFRLIDDKDTVNILVKYNEGAELIELLKRKGPEPWLMQKLQRFSVSVHQNDYLNIKRTGCVEEVHGCYIQSDPYLYDSSAGLAFNFEGIEELMLVK